MEVFPIILKSKSMEIRLEDHTLPAPPLSFTTGLKIKKNEYPGNPDPTVQVLNESFNSIEFTGRFKDWLAKEDGFAERRRNELQAMKAAAEETVMQYASQIFVGMIEELTFNTYHIREIEYKIKFNVFSMDLKKTPRVISNTSPNIAQLKQKASFLKDAVDAVKDLSQKIKDIHYGIQSKINELKEDTGLNDVNELISTTNSILVELKSMQYEVRNIGRGTFIDTISLEALNHNISSTQQQTRQVLDAAQSSSNNTNKVLYIVAQGDTLYTIANKFYGDPNLWYKIAMENNLQHMELTVGQKLVIPI